jgi:hypothetical protein
MWDFSDFFIGVVAGLFGGGVLASIVFALCFVVSICERQQAAIASASAPVDIDLVPAAEPEQPDFARVLAADPRPSSTV